MNVYWQQPRQQLQILPFQTKSASLLRHIQKIIWAYQSVSSSSQVWNIHVLSSVLGPTFLPSRKRKGCSYRCWETFLLPSVFDTDCVLLSNSHNKCYTENTCCFPIPFLSLQWRWLLSGLFSLHTVHKVGRCFDVPLMRGKELISFFAYDVNWCFQPTCWNWCFQPTTGQDCVGSCESTYNRFVPSGLRYAPALQETCYSLSVFLF